MDPEQLVICGGLSRTAGADALRLNLWGKGSNATLQIADLHQNLYRNMAEEFWDLVEIATYVYCADQAVRRSGQDTDTFGQKWRRSFRFVIPVRKRAFWNKPEVKSLLERLLEFLSDDFYQFEFVAAQGAPEFQQYLEFDSTSTGTQVDQVMMFSGGLDSLAGAIEEIKTQRRNVMLVTHVPTAKNSAFLRKLGTALKQLASGNPPFHVSVRINKEKDLGNEYTQRTRSFLFSALGFAVARMVGTDNLRFYENGVVSLNLPLCTQVVGSRATRTTHPRVLAEMSALFSQVAGQSFQVTNPFIWSTKADVVKSIVNAGAGDLIGPSVSCAHTWERTLEHTHCGACSQCIDRRFAIIAAGAEALDPVKHYKLDVFTQARSQDEDRILTTGYIERAKGFQAMKAPAELIAAYPVVARALKHLGGTPANASQRVLDLHQRHGAEVMRALKAQVAQHAADLLDHKLPGDCLIRIAIDSQPTMTPAPTLPANRIARKGGAWEIAFASRPSILVQKHRRGCTYLQALLQNPSKSFTVAELLSASGVATTDAALAGAISVEEFKDGFGATTGIPLTDSGDAFDKEAMKQYRVKLIALQEKLAEAKELNDEAAWKRIEDEISAIAGHVSKNTGKGGRIKKLGDLRKRQRDAVRNSLGRTLAEIATHETVLGAHFKKTVKLGNNSGYFPDPTVSWSATS